MATNNALNNASHHLKIDPGASGDSFVQFDINTTGEFRIGVDDDAADAFKISQGSALGTSDTFIITAAGEITKPLQPSFLTTITATIPNVTGDGTVYTSVWGTEIFDQANNFDATSTFTAPITGRYRFNSGQLLGEVATGHTSGYFNLVTSNRSYKTLVCDYGNVFTGGSLGQVCIGQVAVLADMDAADTTQLLVMLSGSGKTVDFLRSATATNPRGCFCGTLVC